MKSSQKKTLSDLNLIDSFLFSCSTEDIKDAEFISKLIIERATGHTIDKVYIETEKQFKGINIDERGIRLDICVSEIKNGKIAKVYDIEPNKYKKKELFHRSRYYQSLTDSKRLYAGKEFDELPDFISIWILAYDPFAQNRMMYSVRNLVTEDPTLMYNDGVMKLFLYTDGEKGGSRELKDLLNFFKNTCEANAVDDDLRQLFNIVSKIKQSEKVGELFMRFKNDLDFEREIYREEIQAEVRAEVRAEVQAEVRAEVQAEVRAEVQAEVRAEVQAEALRDGEIKGIINSGKEFGISDEQIITALIKECNLTEEEAREKLASN